LIRCARNDKKMDSRLRGNDTCHERQG